MKKSSLRTIVGLRLRREALQLLAHVPEQLRVGPMAGAVRNDFAGEKFVMEHQAERSQQIAGAVVGNFFQQVIGGAGLRPSNPFVMSPQPQRAANG